MLVERPSICAVMTNLSPQQDPIADQVDNTTSAHHWRPQNPPPLPHTHKITSPQWRNPCVIHDHDFFLESAMEA